MTATKTGRKARALNALAVLRATVGSMAEARGPLRETTRTCSQDAFGVLGFRVLGF